MIQDAVNDLCRVGPKLTDDLEAEQLDVATARLDALVQPLSSEDIRALMSLLPAEGDTAFGLNWTILHSIEAAPDWPLWDTLRDEDNDWVRIFRRRLANAGFYPPSDDDSGRGRPMLPDRTSNGA